MIEYGLAAMVALMALQIVLVVYMIWRLERPRPKTTANPVVEAIYQDALKTLEEHGKTLQR